MHIYIQALTSRPEEAIKKLVQIWERSVKATHTFLAPNDIQTLKPFVADALLAIPHLYVLASGDGNYHGFMGLDGDKIEMLFIEPEQTGCGFGKELIEHAIKAGAQLVDVNEQNPNAVGFYQHMGFATIQRSPLDADGNPFPILHMQLKS